MEYSDRFLIRWLYSLFFYTLVFFASLMRIGKDGMDFAAAGIVGMCITGYLMELWETVFAGCGKVFGLFHVL